MKYLIMKCEELNDQYECDANRTPMMLVDNWKSLGILPYCFEVWENTPDGFKCIKNYEDFVEEGMAFGYYDWSEEYDGDAPKFHLIKKFPNRTRKAKCPSDIL